jgi:hypothetical protein
MKTRVSAKYLGGWRAIRLSTAAKRTYQQLILGFQVGSAQL